MHQPIIFARSRVWLQVWLFCILLCSGQGLLVSNLVVAAGQPAQAKQHRAMKHSTIHNTIRVLKHGDVAPTPGPDISVVSSASSSAFSVGQPVTFTITISNNGTSVESNPINLTVTLPQGLTGISASASSNWSTVQVAGTTSPATITASYFASLDAGASDSSFTIQATPDGTVVGPYALSARVASVDDSNFTNNSTSNNFVISLSGSSPTAIPTEAVSPTVIPTETASPTAVVSPTAIPTEAASPTAIPTETASPTAVPTEVASPTAVPTEAVIPTVAPTETVNPTPTALLNPPTGPILTPVLTSNETPVPTHTSAPIEPTATQTPEPPTVYSADLQVTRSDLGGGTYIVGQQVDYQFKVWNTSGAGPLTIPGSLTLVDVLPVGLSNLVASGTDWSISMTSTTSPATLVAIYHGVYPIEGGTILPLIDLTGTVTAAAAGSITDTAGVNAPQNKSQHNENVATHTIEVVPVLISTPTPTPTIIPTPTPTFEPFPDFSIVKTHLKGENFTVGDTVTYQLEVSSELTGGTEYVPNSIIVTDVLPVGFKDLSAAGSGWDIHLTSSIGPAVLTATYIGSYPIPSGEALPTIQVSGTLTNDASSRLTNTALVESTGDGDPSNNVAIDTIFVQHPQQNNQNNNHQNQNNQNNQNNNNNNNNHHSPSLPNTGSPW
ncbi:DUF11 domain-containing protein [Tengunoibacter tsumagoiensis]|uniref:DUF11 domain-containing protein n=1 Tax=Tengunoibacter tsumagoiensis TaxID=2014871 RepID=A0A401ZV88_9CHLR|nr:DUF11 domain-containing protein [Tengunoibacter tsumagoiensis]GCE10803.1 hypothetical protein KTT_06620 [Tengunoibacter tsumagoiensis]